MTMTVSWKILSSTALTAIASAVPLQAMAQDALPPQTDEVSEFDIVVTAQKRETDIQSTPIAVTAIGGDSLKERGISTAADLAMFVPGANFSTNGGATSITIRGIGSDGLSQPKDDASVASHLDGVYLPRPASLAATMYDIQRVEVLRGPQGTLYGRNATGGALNIISNEPSDRFEAGGDLSFGNYDAVLARVMVNAPLGDSFKLRGSVVYDVHDGYSTQLTPGFKDGDDSNSLGGRLTAAWTPDSSLSVVLRANFFTQDNAGQTRNLLDTTSLRGVTDANGVAYGSTTGAIIVDRCALGYAEACDNPRAYQSVFQDRQEIKSNTYSGTVTWDITDAISLKAITGYTDFKQDRDSSSRPFAPVARNASFDFLTTSRAFTQEVNLNYDSGGRLKAVLGGFYLRDKGKNLFDNIAINPNAVASIEVVSFVTTKSKAVFGEASFEILDGLNLTGGIRYTDETKSGNSLAVIQIPFRPTLSIPLVASTGFTSSDFKAGFDWQATDWVFVYGNYSTAFKSGGINFGSPINLAYNPEKLRAWQGGVRTEWFDRRLRLNLDAYHYKYKNPQITQVFGGSLETQNAQGGATIKGFEVTLDARPVDGLTFGAQYSYASGQYGSGLLSDIIDLDQFGQNVFGQIQIGGNDLRFTPKHTIALNASYRIPVSASSDFTIRGDYFWQDDTFARAQNLPVDRIDSFQTINAAARLTLEDKKYFIEVFGKNLTNETIVSARFVNPLHFAEYRPPRTYGVTIGVNFGQ